MYRVTNQPVRALLERQYNLPFIITIASLLTKIQKMNYKINSGSRSAGKNY